jgi:hypothetical protein
MSNTFSQDSWTRLFRPERMYPSTMLVAADAMGQWVQKFSGPLEVGMLSLLINAGWLSQRCFPDSGHKPWLWPGALVLLLSDKEHRWSANHEPRIPQIPNSQPGFLFRMSYSRVRPSASSNKARMSSSFLALCQIPSTNQPALISYHFTANGFWGPAGRPTRTLTMMKANFDPYISTCSLTLKY